MQNTYFGEVQVTSYKATCETGIPSSGFSFWSFGVSSLPLPCPFLYTKCLFIVNLNTGKTIFVLYNCIVCVVHQHFSVCVMKNLEHSTAHSSFYNSNVVCTSVLNAVQWVETVCVEQSEHKLSCVVSDICWRAIRKSSV